MCLLWKTNTIRAKHDQKCPLHKLLPAQLLTYYVLPLHNSATVNTFNSAKNCSELLYGSGVKATSKSVACIQQQYLTDLSEFTWKTVSIHTVTRKKENTNKTLVTLEQPFTNLAVTLMTVFAIVWVCDVNKGFHISCKTMSVGAWRKQFRWSYWVIEVFCFFFTKPNTFCSGRRETQIKNIHIIANNIWLVYAFPLLIFVIRVFEVKLKTQGYESKK